MSYQVTAPLVIIPNVDKKTGDGYFYVDAIVPGGWNDERCDQLVKDGFLSEVSAPAAEPSGPPAKSATKADWEAYARSQGATDEDLKDVTKDDLVATYGE